MDVDAVAGFVPEEESEPDDGDELDESDEPEDDPLPSELGVVDVDEAPEDDPERLSVL